MLQKYLNSEAKFPAEAVTRAKKKCDDGDFRVTTDSWNAEKDDLSLRADMLRLVPNKNARTGTYREIQKGTAFRNKEKLKAKEDELQEIRKCLQEKPESLSYWSKKLNVTTTDLAIIITGNKCKREAVDRAHGDEVNSDTPICDQRIADEMLRLAPEDKVTVTLRVASSEPP